MKGLLENFALGPQKFCLFPILASQKLFPMTGDHSGLRLEVEVKLAYSQVSPWDQDEDKHPLSDSQGFQWPVICVACKELCSRQSHPSLHISEYLAQLQTKHLSNTFLSFLSGHAN